MFTPMNFHPCECISSSHLASSSYCVMLNHLIFVFVSLIVGLLFDLAFLCGILKESLDAL